MAFLAHATPQDISPFRNTPKPERNREYLWLKPEIVVEVSFHQWTPRGELREARFLALRHDKLAREVTVEPAIDPDRLSWAKAPVETVGRVMAAGSDL
ncbi:hypothetical protein [Paraburkholderia piptadeniae]|uniref:ATP dependent DNA ligase n=1 Tax=Paraburkholderia piptadeniae TaxID=1701573 RepID=UPI001F423A7F|nr:hypothetical protein [Paraburkholderia piptadeniae]